MQLLFAKFYKIEQNQAKRQQTYTREMQEIAILRTLKKTKPQIRQKRLR